MPAPEPHPGRPPALRGLVVDWGGVLTGPSSASSRPWAAPGSASDLDAPSDDALVVALTDLLGPGAALDPAGALERGHRLLPAFERRLAQRLTAAHGRPVPPQGLAGRLSRRWAAAPTMTALVRRARTAGLRTALLSNAPAGAAPPWTGLFDAVVLLGTTDGEPRKPEPLAFTGTAARLGLPLASLVVVDDLAVNVRAAAALGAVGVQHRDYDETADELEVLFGLELRGG